MSQLIDGSWIKRLAKIDYAFQPIVNIHTGNTFGFEALLRCHEQAGFSSIGQLFDTAHEQGVLHQVDLFLREKVLKKFMAFKKDNHAKLFYNLDNRLFDSMGYAPGNTITLLDTYGYSRDDICFEISEKHKFQDNIDASKIMAAYRSQGFKIAVDDCGTGFAGLQLIYYTEPHYIKIDRFFVQNMENDPKKRLVVSTLVNYAHLMGSLVLAEGVETLEEYAQCKEIGCDMIQGYFVQRPTREMAELKSRYKIVADISRVERRNGDLKDRSLITGEIKYIKPIFFDCDILTVIDRFRKGENISYLPVINHHEEPVGLIQDTAFKEYIYSKFGRQLLENPSFGKNITRFITKIPITDIHSSVEKLIEAYTHSNNNQGLIMVDDMKYVGVLSTNALLKLINEKNLTLARNQNPLTRLPGNTMIHEYFSESLADMNNVFHLIYFDFDNFKPYNDLYGFRNGDRQILMFADLLKKAGISEDRFIGHVGGDDFFMGIKGATTNAVKSEMSRLAQTFKKNAESFYDKKTVENGMIRAKDRDGLIREIPLITVSIAILELPRDVERDCSIEEASNIIAQLKKEAKQSKSGISHANIMEFLCMKKIKPLHDESKFAFDSHSDQCHDLTLVQSILEHGQD